MAGQVLEGALGLHSHQPFVCGGCGRVGVLLGLGLVSALEHMLEMGLEVLLESLLGVLLEGPLGGLLGRLLGGLFHSKEPMV